MARTAYSDLNGYGSRRSRTGKLAKAISIGGLLLTVGTALYRFRKQWVPKVSEMKDDLRDRMEKSDFHPSAMMGGRADSTGSSAHIH